MQRLLCIMRHAKSDWSGATTSDFERPLNERGRRDASTMGRWMAAQGITPDIVLSSPALRAKQTAQRICTGLGHDAERILWLPELYLAGLATLLRTLSDVPASASRVLLIGHNPGLEELLLHLSSEPLPYTRKGKLLATANLAEVQLPRGFDKVSPRCARNIRVTRPGDV